MSLLFNSLTKNTLPIKSKSKTNSKLSSNPNQKPLGKSSIPIKYGTVKKL